MRRLEDIQSIRKMRALPMHKTRGGALIHAYEDLARHRGQMEITRDIIRGSVRTSG